MLISQKTTIENQTVARNVVSIVAFCFCVIVSLGNESAIGQQLFLRDQAKISGSIVRLGDLADVVGGSLAQKSQLRSLELFPMSDGLREISAHQVREELSQMGLDLLYWRMAGANRVSIRSDNGQATDFVKSSTIQSLRSDPTGKNVSRRDSSLPVLRPSEQRTLIGNEQIRLASFQAGDNTSGNNANSNSPSPGTEDQTTDQSPNAWTVKQNLSRGQIIGLDDLQPVYIATRLPSNLVTDSRELIGMSVRSQIASSRPIVSSMVEPVLYVQRGKEVKIFSRVEGIEVSTTGRSLADGGIGQIVTVESLVGKKKFIGRVIDFQVVQITGPPQAESSQVAGTPNLAVNPRANANSRSNRNPVSGTRLPRNSLR